MHSRGGGAYVIRSLYDNEVDEIHLRRPTPLDSGFPSPVGASEVTSRRALARGRVYMSATMTAAIAGNAVAKGDVLGTARVAGIMAAKQAASLLPMSHPVLVGNVYINFVIGDRYVEVEASVDTIDRTGVEMEALASVTVAALTIYDMCKSADRTMYIGDVALWEKSGGRSGSWRRPDQQGQEPSSPGVHVEPPVEQ